MGEKNVHNHRRDEASKLSRENYSWFRIKGTWSVHSFNGGYLSITEGIGSCVYLLQESPGIAVAV